MNRGGKFLVSTTILAVAACGGQDGKLEIRATPTPLAQGKQPVPYRIAEARGQLALGNVALALEAFRAAAREDPNSIDALTGVAICYDQMGRYDLSRRSYETALALAPADLSLLGAFAASLQRQGLTAEALSVRQEIAARTAVSVDREPPQLAAIPPAPVITASSKFEEARPAASPPVQIAAVEPKPAAAPLAAVAPDRTPEPALRKAEFAAPAPAVVAPAALPEPAPQRVARVAKVEQPKSVALPTPVQTAAIGPSITIKLPPARPVQSAPAPVAVPAATVAVVPSPAPEPAMPHPAPIPAQAPMPVEAPMDWASVAPMRLQARPMQEPAVITEKGPRLERISMGEIALITSVGPPVWASTTLSRTDRSTTLRFVPLRQASMQPVKVRLLNAARVNRLAARTRTWLSARGWRGMSIGNATATRARSVILYPAGKRAFAQRLSAQFGFPLARRASGAHVTVLLGADAARHRAGRPSRA
jgi:hypothetical protein